MKIYFIDESGRYNSLIRRIESEINQMVIPKETKNFRATKSDVVVCCGFDNKDESYEALKKYNNLIVLVDSKDEKVINELAFEYNAKDIVYLGLNEDYIAERISKNIKNFVKE